MPTEVIKIVLDHLARSDGRTIHYHGYADEGLIKAILATHRFELTLMDTANRWGSSTRFFSDEFEGCGKKSPECPAWLEGVTCFEEGSPEADVWIQDDPWNESSLNELLQQRLEHNRRVIPHVLLIGEGIEHPLHPAYRWTDCGGVVSGFHAPRGH